MKKERRMRFSALLSVLLLTIAIFCSFEVNVVKAYHSGTHEFIFNQANQILKNDGWTSISDFLSSLDPSDPNGRTYLEVMIAGSSDHDNILPPPIVGDSSCWEHYMDPTDHHGIGYMGVNMKNAGQLCEERFTAALNDWVVDGNRHVAMYDLGWAVHLVQDLCVPQHAYPTWENGHSAYEDWVDSNKESFAVTTGGIYTFSSFPDSEYYSPAHYEGPYANHGFDWVDFNAHESIKYWGSVNYASGWQADDYFVETVHSLPNSVSTTWVVTEYQASQIQIHFASIQMQPNFDYVKIYDANDNLIASYTGTQSNVWTPIAFGNTLKIKTTTDLSVQSWGYKTDTVKFYDTGEDLEGATAALLSRAQRTTAGFIKCFFDKVSSAHLEKSTVYLENACDKPHSGGSWFRTDDPSSFSGIVMKAAESSPNSDILYGPYITKDLYGKDMGG